ncbi:hypothetical protein GE09DRAFT_1218771 [Coniochaeta sp. 2T2.1]|nr:hypothetical protein GE09DRAFT_1218771 [Coniochaeta sp. 2T2.1]
MSSESSSPKLEQLSRSHSQESHHSHNSKKSSSSESKKHSHASPGHRAPQSHARSRSRSRTPHPSFNPDAPSGSSSSSGSKGSHTTPHPPLSHSRGRTLYRHSTLHRSSSSPSSSSISSSSSSSSTNPAEHHPFSVRDIENLDAVVNTHLDQLGLLLRDLDYHQDHLDRFEDEKDYFAWQLFLAQTSACGPRFGSGSGTTTDERDGVVFEEASGGGRQRQVELMRTWKGAAKNERRAGRNVEMLEGRLAEFVGILFRLVKERDRRRRRGEKGKGKGVEVL